MTGGGSRKVVVPEKEPDPTPSPEPISETIAAKDAVKKKARKTGRGSHILAQRMMQGRQIFNFGKSKTGE